MGKLPAFLFYPSDWRKDPGVQALNYHDRGVWFEILCLMHESEQRGKLLLNGKPMPEDALARLLGLDKQNLTKTLKTFLDYGVISRSCETGVLINRRMVRDEEIRKIRQESGSRGGNPALKSGSKKDNKNDELKILLNQNPNQNPTTPLNQNPTPSVSVTVTSLKDQKKKSIHSLKNSYGNILLTDDEYHELKERYNTNFDDVLNFINLKIQSKGLAEWRKQYKSDYATILVWDKKGYLPEGEKNKQPVKYVKPALIEDKNGNIIDVKGTIVKTKSRREREIRQDIQEGLRE